jgi:IS1 family transposase/transposase-like protein
MTCRKCEHGPAKHFGFTKAKTPRYRCRHCGATFTAPKQNPLGTHTTSVQDAARVFELMIEGISLRAISRITGIHKTTILSLLNTVGAKCARLMDARVRNLAPASVQADEIWQYCYAKEKNVPELMKGVFGFGDVWTWTAIDADSKLIISWYVGARNVHSATAFMTDLASRVTNKIQLTTDGHRVYWPAIVQAFGGNVDYGMMNKLYAESGKAGRYSPGRFIAAKREVAYGSPEPSRISTSFVERHNLTLRMSLRRFTRLTNAFSKKLDNLTAAVAVFMAWYNFCRMHQTLKGQTPAMRAGLTDHVWSMGELLAA